MNPNKSSKLNREATEQFLKKYNSHVGILIVAFFGGFVAWSLIEYGTIAYQESLLVPYDSSYHVREITPDTKPLALARVGQAGVFLAFSGETKVYSNESLGISFRYPAAYTDTTQEGTTNDSVVLTDISANHVIAVVRHQVDSSVAVTEFVDQHEKDRLNGCIDKIDCIISEDSEYVTVANLPTVIRIPTEYIAYVRGEDEIYEILVTSSQTDLTRVLDSIEFLK